MPARIVLVAALLCAVLQPVVSVSAQTPLPARPAAPLPDAPSTLDEPTLLRRLGAIYTLQAQLLAARADGDTLRAESLAATAMDAVGELLVDPSLLTRASFQALYTSVLVEHERLLGPPDTLGLPMGDIYAVRDSVFAAINGIPAALIGDLGAPVVASAPSTVPMPQNRLVEQSMQYLLKQPEKHLYGWLSRGETYLPMVEQIFAEEGVPDELKYLAMVESGMNPQARSWAQAVGMWQFIAATGRAYDLQVNTWVDDRMDPEKATRAAARHLKDLYKMFGDWHLALAGYNYSPGKLRYKVRRATRRLGRPATYWDVYDELPRETRGYVPMFVAASLIASNPAAYGIHPAAYEPGPRYAYDKVPVRGALALETIAELAGTDAATIRALNPHFRRASLPPTSGAVWVRIPMGSAARFMAGYADLPAELKQTSTEYTVQRGDVLGSIAKRYGTSVRALMQQNGLGSTTIHPGQRLVVPMSSYASTVRDDAEPISVHYGPRAIRPVVADGQARAERPAQPAATRSASTSTPVRNASARTESPQAEKPTETRIVYTVRRGDSLGKIASRYGVSVSDVRGWNGLRGSTIHPGQRLKLYPDGAAPAPAATTYRVRRGDTLGKIASRHGVTVAQLKAWNDLRSTRIQVGQELTIRGGEATASGPITYRVRRGDTLGEIAKRHGVSITQIKTWNNLRTSRIQAGQELKLHV